MVCSRRPGRQLGKGSRETGVGVQGPGVQAVRGGLWGLGLSKGETSGERAQGERPKPSRGGHWVQVFSSVLLLRESHPSACFTSPNAQTSNTPCQIPNFQGCRAGNGGLPARKTFQPKSDLNFQLTTERYFYCAGFGFLNAFFQV